MDWQLLIAVGLSLGATGFLIGWLLRKFGVGWHHIAAAYVAIMGALYAVLRWTSRKPTGAQHPLTDKQDDPPVNQDRAATHDLREDIDEDTDRVRAGDPADAAGRLNERARDSELLDPWR